AGIAPPAADPAEGSGAAAHPKAARARERARAGTPAAPAARAWAPRVAGRSGRRPAAPAGLLGEYVRAGAATHQHEARRCEHHGPRTDRGLHVDNSQVKTGRDCRRIILTQTRGPARSGLASARAVFRPQSPEPLEVPRRREAAVPDG